MISLYSKFAIPSFITFRDKQIKLPNPYSLHCITRPVMQNSRYSDKFYGVREIFKTDNVDLNVERSSIIYSWCVGVRSFIWLKRNRFDEIRCGGKEGI